VFRALLPNATHVLCHSEATVLGIRFYACPWHWGHKSNYTLKPTAPANTSGKFQDIPDGIHVLITHGPAIGRLDLTTEGEHWGSKELLDALVRVKPSLHLHGHVSEARGFIAAFGRFPLTINSCMVDKHCSVLYATAHVIKCTKMVRMSPGTGNANNNSGIGSGGATRNSDGAYDAPANNSDWTFSIGSLG
jgi:hypothetical protein